MIDEGGAAVPAHLFSRWRNDDYIINLHDLILAVFSFSWLWQRVTTKASFRDGFVSGLPDFLVKPLIKRGAIQEVGLGWDE